MNICGVSSFKSYLAALGGFLTKIEKPSLNRLKHHDEYLKFWGYHLNSSHVSWFTCFFFPSIPHVSCLPVGRDPGGGSLCRAFGGGWHRSGGCLPCSAGGGHRREAGRAGSAVPLRISWGQFDRFFWDQLRITIDYSTMLVKQS